MVHLAVKLSSPALPSDGGRRSTVVSRPSSVRAQGVAAIASVRRGVLTCALEEESREAASSCMAAEEASDEALGPGLERVDV